MKFSILTIFPRMFDSLNEGPLMKRAQERGLAEAEFVDVKDFADGSFRHIDDSPYGGGAGMVMRPEPLIRALESVRTEKSRVVVFAASGTPYTQKTAERYAQEEHLILICGHYEGIDERVIEEADDVISVGDYVLSGGEYPAMTVMDSVVRLLGTIRQSSVEEESFSAGLLEYPQYTKPADFRGRKVPEVLLSGNHEAIRRWRLKQSLKRTQEVRPDLMAVYEMTEEEKRLLEEAEDE